MFKKERLSYNIYMIDNLDNQGGDTPMTDNLLNSMERINVVAELLYNLLGDNPRAQVLAEIIVEASQANQK